MQTETHEVGPSYVLELILLMEQEGWALRTIVVRDHVTVWVVFERALPEPEGLALSPLPAV